MRAEFSSTTKRTALQRAHTRCQKCGILLRGSFHYDHIVPTELSRDNSLDNAQCLCLDCHRAKTRLDWPLIAKSNRVRRKHAEHLARLAEKGKL